MLFLQLFLSIIEDYFLFNSKGWFFNFFKKKLQYKNIMPNISVKKIQPNATQDSQEEKSPRKKFFEYISINILQIKKKYTIKIKNNCLLLTEKVLINKFLILDLNEPNDFALFINLLFYFFKTIILSFLLIPPRLL